MYSSCPYWCRCEVWGRHFFGHYYYIDFWIGLEKNLFWIVLRKLYVAIWFLNWSWTTPFLDSFEKAVYMISELVLKKTFLDSFVIIIKLLAFESVYLPRKFVRFSFSPNSPRRSLKECQNGTGRVYELSTLYSTLKIKSHIIKTQY